MQTPSSRAAATYALAVLFAANALNFFDRQIGGALGEPIRREFGVSDASLAWLSTAFTLVYAAVGVPLGRLADRLARKRLLAAGVFVWSLFTSAAGVSKSFAQLFLTRLGVGIGEATCAPASTSLIGDLYPADRRSRALSVFMLGLPVGIALSFAVSSSIAAAYGWRSAFFVAGIPGVLCAAALLWVREPQRGASEAHRIGARRRPGSPYLLVLSVPTMAWIIASGALHNFNMYALAQFLSPYLMRFHGLGLRDAGLVATAVFGLAGILGLFAGGVLGDAVTRRFARGRLLVGAVSAALSVPLVWLALQAPSRSVVDFAVAMGAGCAAMYVYYSVVYPTIHDVVEPSLRGTAMALYFFAMYVLGASLGPVGTGAVSDFFTERAAQRAGVADPSDQALLEPFRAEGLRAALYQVPILGTALALVLFLGARTVTRDRERLQRWMRESGAV